MTEHKFTDEEVIRALECLAGDDGPCRGCIYQKTPFPTCRELVGRQALDLINRQKAENAQLQEENQRMKKYYFTHDYHECHNEAIKELAERVKENLDDFFRTDEDATLDTADMIDTLVKEMTEGEQ